MKARVKGTNHIIDVELYHHVGDTSWYITKYQTQYSGEDLEFIDEPTDYWTSLEHTYAGMAMQGLMTILPNIGGLEGRTPKDEIVDIAMDIAHALVEKLKGKEEK